MSNTKKYPNVILAGAPKSGTSSLFFWLGAHPEVCASKIKETYFLSDNVNRHNSKLNIHQNDLEEYQDFFVHCTDEKIRLEATPVYIYHKQPLKSIPKLPVTPKIIFILRKPGDRLYSHWKFNRYRMKNTSMTFREYLDISNKPETWQDYLKHTHYVDYIREWIRVLGKDQILVYQFEKMRDNQGFFMKKVALDLNIDPGFYNDFDFFHRNETVAVKNKKLHRLGLKIEPLVPQWLQEKIIPMYMKFNAGKAPSITSEEKLLKEEVNAKFKESNKALKELFPELDLSIW